MSDETKKKTYTLRYFAFGIGVSILMSMWSFLDSYERLEWRTYDERFVLRGVIEQHPAIGTIDIDDETYQAEGRFEDWTRDKHALLIDILAEFGVDLIGFDIFFPEPSRSVISREAVQDRINDEYTAEEFLALFEDYDAQLAQSAQRAGNVVFSHFFTKADPEASWEFIVNNTVKREGSKEESFQRLGERGFYFEHPDVDVSQTTLPKMLDFLPPLPKFVESVKHVGFVQPFTDGDGVVRWYEMFRVYDGKLFPAIALVMVCDYLKVPMESLEIRLGDYVRLPNATLQDGTVKDVTIPIDEGGKMLVNWTGDYQETFLHYPYERIIQLKELYGENVVLRDVKRLIVQDPALLEDMDAFIMKAIEFNIQPPDAAMTAFQTVGIFRMFEEAIMSDKEMDARDFFVAQGVPEDQIPEDMVEKYDELRYNVLMSEHLTANPELSLTEMADLLGVLRLDLIEHGYYALKNLVEHGGIKPEHHPLIFFTVIHEGKELLPADLDGKLLVYGLTATGTQDMNPTPFNPRYQMVGYHANAMNTILMDQFLDRMDHHWRITLLVVLGIIMGVLVPRFGPAPGGAIVGGLLLTHSLSAYFFFVYGGYWIDIVGPVGVIVVSYLAVSINNYLIERKERAYIQDSFKMYLSPAVVDQIADNPGLLSLGGRRAELTILFTDVAGFSTISEQMTAEGLVELLNEYLGTMTDIIMDNNGTVDKYEGDLIMAFWGAPIDNPNHAIDACKASIIMNDRLAEMRKMWTEMERPDYITRMDARIGLNTGDVVVGNMGSQSRMDYTVMGDHVNLASRLEGANKPYGTHIMISEFTYFKVRDELEARKLDVIRVVGRDEPVTVYELLNVKGQVDSRLAEVVAKYNEALEIYEAREWTGAQEKFFEALRIDEDDGPTQTYLDRCERYLAEPPPADWDGVETLTEK
ncbi:MAG: CHASE2 domain-containing protein [Candidatus Latescibacteria bacterium]|nr:CHASE2 domain-containing protein [Candidatus Latescibacterota bacterium]